MIKGVRLWQQIIVSGLLLLVPASILLGVVVRDRSKTIGAAVSQHGNVVSLQGVGRILGAAVGTPPGDSLRTSARDLAQLKAFARTSHPAWSASARPLQAVEEAWRQAENPLDAQASQRLVAALLVLEARIMSATGPIVLAEPEADQSIDLAQMRFAPAVARLHQITNLVDELATGRRASPQAPVQIARLLGGLEADLDQTETSLGATMRPRSGKASGALSRLGPRSRQHLQQCRQVVQLVREASLPADADAVRRACQQAQGTLLTWQRETLAALDDGLRRQVGRIKQGRNVTVLAILLLTAIPVLLLVLVAARIHRAINELVSAFDTLAEGNFRIRSTWRSRDELGWLAEGFNYMTERLSAVIYQVLRSSREVAETSQQMVYVSEDAARATESIAIRIGELADQNLHQSQSVATGARDTQTMNEVATMVAQNASQVASGMAEAARAARTGKEVLDEAVSKVSALNQTVVESADAVKTLGKIGERIGTIVELISGISSQTNLLALNAAIEAARAGVHGRGFAVVADEVRKLASDSAANAQRITEMIREIQKETAQAVTAMDRGTMAASEGLNLIQSACSAILEIVEAVTTTDFEVESMSYAMVQLSDSLQSIAGVMSTIAGVSEQNAAAAQDVAATTQQQSACIEEVAASSAHLATMMEDLNTLMNHLKFDEVEEEKPHAPPPSVDLVEVPPLVVA